jgi:hypothetical protein
MFKQVLLSIAATVGILSAMSTTALAQTKVYPPGTDCANQPTIAERLLCGRQQFRRESGMPLPPASPDLPRDDGVARPEPMAPHRDDIAPSAVPIEQAPSRTSSPND